MDPSNLNHRDMLLGFEASLEIENILARCRNMYSLPDDEASSLFANCTLYCQCIITLIKKIDPIHSFFNFTLKTHHLLHFGMIAEYTNPQLGSCYDGEVLIGVVRRLVQVVARGSCISRSNEVIWLIHLVLLDSRAGHLTRAWMVVSEVFVWLFLQERQKSSECVMGSRW